MNLKLDVNELVQQIIIITEKSSKAVEELSKLKAEHMELKAELDILQTEKVQQKLQLERDLEDMYKQEIAKSVTNINKSLKHASGE